jgi:Amt family ammonium transporter
MTAAILATTVGLGGIAERATLAAHVVLGVVIGGVVSPTVFWAQRSDGILSSISIGAETFEDAGAASLFSVAGWVALVGIMIIGPRRGRVGSSGQLREIPGKSMPAVVVGALLFFSAAVGVAALPAEAWSDTLPDIARAMVLAGAVGALVAAGCGWVRMGTSSSAHVARGTIAGLVSTAGAPLLLTLGRAAVFGAVGALLALVVIELLESAHVDDPAGIVGVFGAAGIWGSLAVGSTNLSQFAAQVVGLLMIAAWAIVVAGLVFAGLRVARVLRLAPDIEVVGLD